jgi:hypothetical protein
MAQSQRGVGWRPMALLTFETKAAIIEKCFRKKKLLI